MVWHRVWWNPTIYAFVHLFIQLVCAKHLLDRVRRQRDKKTQALSRGTLSAEEYDKEKTQFQYRVTSAKWTPRGDVLRKRWSLYSPGFPTRKLPDGDQGL